MLSSSISRNAAVQAWINRATCAKLPARNEQAAHGRTIHWVNHVTLTMAARRLLYPDTDQIADVTNPTKSAIIGKGTYSIHRRMHETLAFHCGLKALIIA